MALSGALQTHVDSVAAKVASAMSALTDHVVIRSEPTINLAEVICREVRAACQSENMTDVS